MSSDLTKTSKFLSLVLRHRPDRIGLALDVNGWVSVADLIEQARVHGVRLDRELIRRVVATNDKKRFALSADGTKIRANQGHSIDIDLGLEPCQPPEFLFHGTADRALDNIRKHGLRPGKRRHVHLTGDAATARAVGARHGRPLVLRIRAGAMCKDGRDFYMSDNGVWLTAQVPVAFIDFSS
ncbi:MAG: RNA 2'-phosphotransferase [Hyphomicrobiaceae bacterium]